jgi:hypothetical protein
MSPDTASKLATLKTVKRIKKKKKKMKLIAARPEALEARPEAVGKVFVE